MASAGEVMRLKTNPAPVKPDPALVQEFKAISSSGSGLVAEGKGTPAFDRAGFKKFASTGQFARGVFRKGPTAPSDIKGDTPRVNVMADRLSVEHPTGFEGQLLALVLEQAKQENA